MLSEERKKFLKQRKKDKIIIISSQILLVVGLLITWELLAKYKIINSFIFSSPSLIFSTIINLFTQFHLLDHIFVTLLETIIAFIIGITCGLIIAIALYLLPKLAKIIDPFLIIINSLPKVALGPLIIIWCGADKKAIIVMALLINLILSIVTIYNGFIHTDPYKITLMKSFKANKYQTLKYLIIPSSFKTIISSLKINISMTLIGVIMGEFLVSKKGLGYLIIYGTQIFNLNIVMACIIILIIISYLLYQLISCIEKSLLKNTLD